MDALAIRNQKDQSLKHHPYTTLNATLGRAKGMLIDDRTMVQRCLAAYRAAGEASDKEYPSGIWAYVYSRQASNHHTFLHGTLDEGARVLRYPATSYLFYGFDHISPEFTSVLENAPEHLNVIAYLWQDYLIRLAEAVGSFRLENPEGDNPWLQHAHRTTDQIIEAIEERVGCRLSFPNVFPDEFGLESTRGLVAYRAIQAIYQAYRIRSLVSHIDKPRVLEIGAGLGRSAYYARQMGITDYTIIDLPLTSISQGYYLMRVCGENAVQLRGEHHTHSTDRIKLFDPSYFFGEKDRYDLIVNVDSLTEIDQDSAVRYLRKISTLTTQFLSINHEVNSFTVSGLLGSGRMLRFPYWMRPGYVEELVDFNQR